jgi:hypothetical protein
MTTQDKIGFWLDRLNRKMAAMWFGPYALVIIAAQLSAWALPAAVHIPPTLAALVALLWFDPCFTYFGRKRADLRG